MADWLWDKWGPSICHHTKRREELPRRRLVGVGGGGGRDEYEKKW